MNLSIRLPDAEATQALGSRLADVVGPGCITLSGELGAGKTELARALIRALGYAGRVKSPTYTLVEPYETTRLPVSHWDLYRIGAAEELLALGIREQPAGALMLIEWPERASAALPPIDLAIRLETLDNGREAMLVSRSPSGDAWLSALAP